MTISDQLTKSYLQDARRMIAAARAALDCVPVNTDSLLIEIHTLKGTSTMVPHSAPQSCVGILHLIEIKITERPQEPDSWSGLVREVFNLCEKEISTMGKSTLDPQTQPIFQSPVRAVTPTSSLIPLKGVLARVIFQGQSCLGELLWFPLKDVSSVRIWKGFREYDQSDKQTLPVLGMTELSWEHTALAFRVKTEEGNMTLIVKEVVGLCSWKTALQHGAQAGVPFLLEQWKEICDSGSSSQLYGLQKKCLTLSVAAVS